MRGEARPWTLPTRAVGLAVAVSQEGRAPWSLRSALEAVAMSTATPCAVSPARTHLDGPCQCFVGGPAPSYQRDDPEHRCSICTLWFVSTAGLKHHLEKDHGVEPTR